MKRNNKKLAAPIALAAALSLALCGAMLAGCNSGSGATGGSSPNAAATVDDTAITEDEVTERVNTYYATSFDYSAQDPDYQPDSPEKMRSQAIDDLIRSAIVERIAKAEGVETSSSSSSEASSSSASSDSAEEVYAEDMSGQSTEEKLMEKLAGPAPEASNESSSATDEDVIAMFNDYYVSSAAMNADSGQDESTPYVMIGMFSSDDKAAAEEARKEFEEAKDASSLPYYTDFTTYAPDILKEQAAALKEGEVSEPILSEEDSTLYVVKKIGEMKIPQEPLSSVKDLPENILEYMRTQAVGYASSAAYSTAYSEAQSTLEEMIEKERARCTITIYPMPEGTTYGNDASSSSEETSSSEES
ncbi:MAG: peptidyl-prolyl cis-trans isomerase [Eggerthellaceae bacterium]|nr:peptidyl-prolyl cis-trans isomerase [Eggerthellaceae bacterium]